MRFNPRNRDPCSACHAFRYNPHPPAHTRKAEVEVRQRYSVASAQAAALPLEDRRLHLGHDLLERGGQRQVEQRSAVCSGAPNPPGYESVRRQPAPQDLSCPHGREGGGCLHTPHIGWLTKGWVEGDDWAR